MAAQIQWFHVPLVCLYRGCRVEAALPVHAMNGGWGLTPPDGWAFALGIAPTAFAQEMAERVAELFGFAPTPPDVIDQLMARSAKYLILSGGVRNSDGLKKDGVWVTEVEYTRADGKRVVVMLSRAQLSEWAHRR